MKLYKYKVLSLVVLSFLLTAKAFAGSFWFPIDGVYPYTVKVTAFPDLDRTVGVIKTRMGEKGRKANGCIALTVSYPCTNAYKKDYSVWAYKKDGGGKWNLAGVNYVSDPYYMWYDNHFGYDFADSAYVGKGVHAVEDGVIKAINSDWGKVTIEHNIKGVIYRTTYTHMDISKTKADMTVGKPVWRWYKLGTVSNKAPVGYNFGKHLHFTVEKKQSDGSYKMVDPYGEWASGVEVEPYLWE